VMTAPVFPARWTLHQEMSHVLYDQSQTSDQP
jgi:hypothetical protein